ncbi:TPA: hypothetical protein ACPYPV_000543 [Legionella pneumophila]
MATENETIKPVYYLFLFIICTLLHHPSNLSILQPGDKLMQSIGAGLGAIGLCWILTSKSKNNKKRMWYSLATIIILSQFLSNHKSNTLDNNDSYRAFLDKTKIISEELYAQNKVDIDQLSLDKSKLDIDITKSFSPSKLFTKDGREFAKRTIQSYREYIIRYRTILNKLKSKKLTKLRKDEVNNLNYLNKYNKEQEVINRLWTNYFKYEERSVDILLSIVILIETNITNITIENNVFVFENQDELNRYNESIEELQKNSSKEKVLLNKIKSFGTI